VPIQKLLAKLTAKKTPIIALVGHPNERRNHFTNKIRVAPTTRSIYTLKLMTEQSSSTGENCPWSTESDLAPHRL